MQEAGKCQIKLTQIVQQREICLTIQRNDFANFRLNHKRNSYIIVGTYNVNICVCHTKKKSRTQMIDNFTTI